VAFQFSKECFCWGGFARSHPTVHFRNVKGRSGEGMAGSLKLGEEFAAAISAAQNVDQNGCVQKQFHVRERPRFAWRRALPRWSSLSLRSSCTQAAEPPLISGVITVFPSRFVILQELQ